MTVEAPKKDEVNFVVTIYKDMELADEIEFSNSFENYSDALDFYNQEIKKANNNYFVELHLEIEEAGSLKGDILLANNYVQA